MEPTRWALCAVVVIGLIAVLAVSVARTAWDLDYRQTVVAVHLGDLAQQQSSPNALTETVAELREAGATAVTVSPLSVDTLHERFFPQRLTNVSISTGTLNAIREQGLALYWRLDTWVPLDTYQTYLDELMTHEPAGLIGARAVAVPANEMDTLVQTIRDSNRAMIGWAEFAALPPWPDNIEPRARQVFRAHLLERAERDRLTKADALNRYVQAVRERRVRLVEVRASSLDQARQDVSDLQEQLEQSGYSVRNSPQPVPSFSNPASILGTTLRDGLAWLLAVLGPLAAYGLMRRRLSEAMAWWMSAQAWLLASGLSVLGGLAAAAVLSDPNHFLGLRDILGVRPALLLPIAGATLLALGRTSWRDWRPLDGMVWAGVGAALLVALLRSGNFTVLPVPNVELELRNALENLLIVRPRFKEFLIGHPALVLWASLGTLRWRPWAVGLLAVGMLGQVSIVNSFLHLHTPLWVTLLRTVHGLWLGLTIGMILVIALRPIIARFTPTR